MKRNLNWVWGLGIWSSKVLLNTKVFLMIYLETAFSHLFGENSFYFKEKSYFVAFAVLCYLKTHLLKIYHFKGIKA